METDKPERTVSPGGPPKQSRGQHTTFYASFTAAQVLKHWQKYENLSTLISQAIIEFHRHNYPFDNESEKQD
jgi:hypothetical protein